MDLYDNLGCMMVISTLSERTFIGIVVDLNPYNLTVTLGNVWCGEEFFDFILIKATDIVTYDYLAIWNDEQQSSKHKQKYFRISNR